MDRFTLAAVVATVVIFHISSSCAKPLSDVEMPGRCANMNFCTIKHKDYPDKIIDDLLNETRNLYDDHKEGVTQRIANDQDSLEKDECPSVSHVNPIYEIKDNSNRTRFVVQSKNYFMQIIRIEQCEEPGILTRQTRNLPEQVLLTTQLKCVQCMLNYKFLVLGLDGKSLETVAVQGGLPVCCSCQIQE